MWAAKQKAKPKKITLNPTQVSVAHKLGLTTKQYAEGLLTVRNNKPVKLPKPPMQIEMFEPNETIAFKPDPVNHPAHYKVGGIETIDFIEAKKFNYNLGNVVKYVSRADHKGERLENLEKARWYLDREIGNLSEELATHGT
jgi:hypothetical protein